MIASSPDSLVEWLRTKPNGFFSNKISWRQINPDDASSSYAMFASEDIPKDETLIVVPQSALITSKGSDLNCDTVKVLLQEHEKGKDSEYFPYVDYLFGDDTKRGKLPAAWSKDAKELLKAVIGNSLFPTGFDYQSADTFCRKELPNPSQLQKDAYHHMISRSWDDIMIPGKSYTAYDWTLIVVPYAINECSTQYSSPFVFYINTVSIRIN